MRKKKVCAVDIYYHLKLLGRAVEELIEKTEKREEEVKKVNSKGRGGGGGISKEAEKDRVGRILLENRIDCKREVSDCK